jgi:hypothetical protein
MCTEAVWWRGHPRIVADYLINAGRTVYHLMSTHGGDPTKMSEGAGPAGARVRYPSA